MHSGCLPTLCLAACCLVICPFREHMHSVCVCGEGFSGTLSCPVLLPCVLTATLCDGEDVDESKGVPGPGSCLAPKPLFIHRWLEGKF